MRARLVRPDATTEPVDLPARPAEALPVMYALLGCTAVEVVRIVHPGPAGSGADMWVDEEGLLTGDPVINPAAAAVVAFLSRRAVRQSFAGPALFTGGPGPGGASSPLERGYDEVITTITARLREAR